MTKEPISVARRKICVGNNSKPYNVKHPENPVALRPIHDACRTTCDPKLRAKFRALANLSKPEIAYWIARYTREAGGETK